MVLKFNSSLAVKSAMRKLIFVRMFQKKMAEISHLRKLMISCGGFLDCLKMFSSSTDVERSHVRAISELQRLS